MAQYKFMRKNLSKYTSYLLTSIYGLTLESSKGVKDYSSKGLTKKNIDGEVIDIKEKLKRGLGVNNKDITNPKFILEENIEFREILSTEILKSNGLEIVVDREFPNIVQYKIGEKILKGARKSRDEFLINGSRFKPKVTSEKIYDHIEGEYYLYRLNFRKINVEMAISFKIIDNTVKLQFEEINENGEFKIYKIQIPNHNLISINEEEENLDITAARVYGILSSNDYFYDLREKEVDQNPVHQTMAFLDNGGLVASLENNVLDYEKQVYYQTTLNEGVKEAGLWNGSWTYREQLSDSEGGTFSGVTELPWSRIVISGDKNNDDLVD
ncbi:hypothetical protein QTH34_04265 [Clostridium perfringens]|uniref:Galactose mutarotase-like fold domain-containing protein n=1 Tax=Clostridium perfringens TaxID=1502 RepID=A0AAW4IWA5_CLOPF|nr:MULTISPECIES: hypothetical protein [Clostridium]AMN32784.1 hypothetical protein JFP55_07660 [Clostridium perfringens]EGT0692826.1 hypothetical protein [Clostridium perfringens]EHK2355499.1 hypothetical protein [Clostridium perfringens]EHP49438.1 hypothetical protein HMPREF9476_00891 [Clostridium perfringens WAL-14572]EIF2806800.1 hypothetical protein [Clostridium perfringens]